MDQLAIPTVHTLYPAIDVTRNTRGVDRFVHQIGPSWSDHMTAVSESAANNTSAQFQVRFSDKKTSVDPASMILDLPVTMVKVGALGAGNNPYQSRCEGIAANACGKIIKNLKINMDGGSHTYELSKIMYALECTDEIKLDEFEINDGSRMIDNYQQLNDVWGSVSSPYALPSDNVVQANRSSFPLTATYDNVNTTTISFHLYLNLGFLSPFSKQQRYPLSCDNLTISIDFESGHLGRMWRVDATNHPQPNITPTFALGQPNLYYKLNQLPLGLTSPIHEIYQYNRIMIRTVATTSAPIVAGASSILSSGTYEMNQVPRLMLVYLKKAESDFTTTLLDMQTADFFARMDLVRLNFGNRTNCFANATPFQLYDMSRRRGLTSDFTYNQFIANQSGKGSILCFSPIFDVAASGGEILTNGVTMKNVCRFDINFTNMNATNHNFDLVVVEIYDGVIQVDNNLSQIHEVFGTTDSVIRTDAVDFPIETLRGGSKVGDFFKNLWEKGKKIFEVAKPVLQSTKVLSKGASFIPYVGPAVSGILSNLGYGEGGDGGVIAGVSGGYLPSQFDDGIVGGASVLNKRRVRRVQKKNY